MVRREYTKEQKLNVVQEALECGNQSKVSMTYGISRTMLIKWTNTYRQKDPDRLNEVTYARQMQTPARSDIQFATSVASEGRSLNRFTSEGRSQTSSAYEGRLLNRFASEGRSQTSSAYEGRLLSRFASEGRSQTSSAYEGRSLNRFTS